MTISNQSQMSGEKTLRNTHRCTSLATWGRFTTPLLLSTKNGVEKEITGKKFFKMHRKKGEKSQIFMCHLFKFLKEKVGSI